MLEIIYTNRFEKDLKLVKKQGKKLSKLFTVVDKLARGEALDARYREHYLEGEYKGCRECHIEPDWLLIYTIQDKELILILNRTGSHSELFD